MSNTNEAIKRKNISAQAVLPSSIFILDGRRHYSDVCCLHAHGIEQQFYFGTAALLFDCLLRELNAT